MNTVYTRLGAHANWQKVPSGIIHTFKPNSNQKVGLFECANLEHVLQI